MGIVTRIALARELYRIYILSVFLSPYSLSRMFKSILFCFPMFVSGIVALCCVEKADQ